MADAREWVRTDRKEIDMGRVCAWCGTVLLGLGWGASRAPIGQAICGGCMEELESSLAGVGLKLRRVEVPSGR